MTNRLVRELGLGRKVLISMAGALAVVGPIFVGLSAPTHGRARQQSRPVATQAVPAQNQSPNSPQPQVAGASAKVEFEVVSIRPAPSFSSPMESMQYAAVEIDIVQAVLRYITLSGLIQMAYRLPEDRISGPGWMSSVRFDIAAKLPAGSSKDKLPEMLQAMLADRFKMTAHHEERVQPAYLLVLGNRPLKLKKHTGDPESKVPCNGGPGRGYECNGVTMEYFATFLSLVYRMGGRSAGFLSGTFPDRPVINKTGLAGEYDFNLMVGYPGVNIRGGEIPDPDTMIPISVALKELGLALKPSRQPFDYLIVDHIERTPTKN